MYDLYIAVTTLPNLDYDKIIYCFSKYMEFENNLITKKLFVQNMEMKIQNKEFRGEMLPLLPRNQPSFDPDLAYEHTFNKLITRLL